MDERRSLEMDLTDEEKAAFLACESVTPPADPVTSDALLAARAEVVALRHGIERLERHSIDGPCTPAITVEATTDEGLVISCGNCGIWNIAGDVTYGLTAAELVEIIRNHQEPDHG